MGGWMDGWVRSVVPAASPVGKLWQGGDGDREVGISKKGGKRSLSSLKGN